MPEQSVTPLRRVPPDEDARRRIEEELDDNLVVLAGAGSGKTTALVRRLVALARRGTDPEQVVAITFTRKAASEMRTRFHRALREAAEAATEPEERAHLERASGRAGLLFIDTIHAFCGRLLRERPLEAGLPPDFRVLEDRESQELRHDFWRRYARGRLADSPESVEALEARGVEVDDLYSFFGTLCSFEEADVLAEAVPRPDLEGAVEAVRAFVERWQARRPTPRPKERDKLMERLDRAELLLRYTDLESDGARVRLLEEFEGLVDEDGKAKGVTQKNWTAAGLTKDEVKEELMASALPELDRVVCDALSAWRAHLYPECYDFARGAVDAYREERRREGRLTFDDLLRFAADLLKHPEHGRRVRRRAAERMRYFLVDEFQDTDPVQAEVLFLLASDDDGHDWRSCRPRPGSLFIVGDDKQSIYRFRRADVQVFRDVCDLLGDGGRRVVRLTTNFRATEPLCAWCNGAVEPLFAGADPGAPMPHAHYQAPYEPLRAHRTDTPAFPAVVRLALPSVPRNEPAAIAEAEAERMIAWIADAVERTAQEERPLTPGDFMILTRLGRRLPVYARALERAGLPYTLSGGKSFYRSDELRAIVDLLRTVRRPYDPVACLAFLRGLFVGCSDVDLFGFARAGGRFDEPLALPAGLEGDVRERIEGAVSLLGRLRELLATVTVSAALEWIVDTTGFLTHAAYADEGSIRAGNVQRILTFVRQWEVGGMHWTEMLEELELLLAGEVDAEELTLEAGSPDAVRLMTVHQSKGLQARVVFLADPYDPYHRPSPSLHFWREDGRLRAVLPCRRRWGNTPLAAPAAWAEQYEAEARRFDRSEHVRITYVAATRAEDQLVVSCYESKAEGGFWCGLYPHLPEAADAAPAATARREAERPALAFDEMRLRRQEAIRTGARPTFTTGTVTGRAGEAGRQTLAIEPGYESGESSPGSFGRHYGTAVHRLFQEAIAAMRQGRTLSGEDARLLVEETLLEAAEEEALSRGEAPAEGAVADPLAVASALEALDTLQESSLWAALRTADVVQAEVPFAVREAGDPPCVLRGVVDLAYTGAGGWTLVDFKTDRLAAGGLLPGSRHEKYAHQLALYGRHWAELTGEPVVSTVLWLTQTGTLVEVGEISARERPVIDVERDA